MLGEIGESTEKVQRAMPQMGRGQATNFQSQPRHEAPAFAHESIAAPRRWRSSHDPSIPSTHSRSLCCFSTRIPGNLPRKSQGLRSTQRDNTSSPNQLNMLKIKSRGADRKIATGVAACPGSLGFLIGQWYDAKHTDCPKIVEVRLLFCAGRVPFGVALSNFFRPISDGLTYSSYSCMLELLSSNRIWLDGSDNYRCPTRILLFLACDVPSALEDLQTCPQLQ